MGWRQTASWHMRICWTTSVHARPLGLTPTTMAASSSRPLKTSHEETRYMTPMARSASHASCSTTASSTSTTTPTRYLSEYITMTMILTQILNAPWFLRTLASVSSVLSRTLRTASCLSLCLGFVSLNSMRIWHSCLSSRAKLSSRLLVAVAVIAMTQMMRMRCRKPSMASAYLQSLFKTRNVRCWRCRH